MQNNMMTKEQFEHLKERLTFAHKNMSNEASDYRAITDKPIFYIQERYRIYGVNPEYSGICPYEGDSTEHFTEVIDKDNDSSYDSWDELRNSCSDLDEFTSVVGDYEEVTYTKIWIDVCAHLTREAAQLYIDQNKHNLKSPRIYVKSMNRCHEMIGLVEAIMSGKLVYED
ncbi:MAG: hypothetical protein ACRCXK_09160 [Wohlfahrtiimonas sp.]